MSRALVLLVGAVMLAGCGSASLSGQPSKPWVSSLSVVISTPVVLSSTPVSSTPVVLSSIPVSAPVAASVAPTSTADPDASKLAVLCHDYCPKFAKIAALPKCSAAQLECTMQVGDSGQILIAFDMALKVANLSLATRAPLEEAYQRALSRWNDSGFSPGCLLGTPDDLIQRSACEDIAVQILAAMVAVGSDLEGAAATH